MATTNIFDGQLLTTTTNPAVGTFGVDMIVTKATVLNVTASNRTVSLYRVPTGGTVTTTNYAILSALTIKPGTTPLPISGQTLPAGFAFYIKANSANSVNANISLVSLV